MCRFGISFTYLIEGIESKLISVCLINDYSVIADLHIFIYGRAECASISLKYTKVNFLYQIIFNKILKSLHYS